MQCQSNNTTARLGMSHDIGECFLGDAEQGYLDSSRQGRQSSRRFQADVYRLVAQIAVLEDVLVQRGKQPQFVQRWRAQRVHQAAHINHRLLGARNQIGEQRIGECIVGQAIAGCFQLEGQTGEPRSQAVMQVATQATTFFLARHHQPLARVLQVQGQALEIGGEMRGMYGDTDLPRQVTQ